MAEVHPAPAATTEISPAHGSILITLQHDVGSIKREIKDLRTMVESLIKEVKDLKRVKVETAVGNPFSCVSFPAFHPLSPRGRSPLPAFASVFTRITVDPPHNRHFFPIIGPILRYT